jgi:hypothetical protein
MTFQWTDARLRILRDRHAAGVSSAKIASELGTTKGTVCGKLWRLGLQSVNPLPAQPIVTPPPTVQPTDQPPAAPPVKKPKKEETVKPLAERRANISRPQPKPYQPRGLGLNDAPLKADECRWPINDTSGASIVFCCKPAIAGGSYCKAHAEQSRQRSH